MPDKEIILVLCLLFATGFLLITNLLRMDIVALLVLAVIGLTGLLPNWELFSGFASEAVLALIATMIISRGLEKTGISIKIAKSLLNISKNKPNKVLFLLLLTTSLIAGIMRSIATVALLLPVVSRVAKRTRIRKKYLLLPMAFCSILGGMLTMVGTGSLIVINTMLKNASEFAEKNFLHEYLPFALFDVLPIGLALLVIGIPFLLFICKKYFLDFDQPAEEKKSDKQNDFSNIYDMGGKLHELSLTTKSTLISMRLDKIEAILPSSTAIVGIKKGKQIYMPAVKNFILIENDVIAILAKKGTVEELAQEHKLRLKPQLEHFADIMDASQSGFCEAVIPPQSNLCGVQVAELNLRRNYGMQILALSRKNEVYKGHALKELKLKGGDTLGLYSSKESLREFSRHSELFAFSSKLEKFKLSKTKIILAYGFLLLSLYLMLFANYNLSLSLMLCACGMIACRIVSTEEAYGAINWRTIFLAAGLLPLGLVMQKSGSAAWLIDIIEPYILHLSPYTVLLGISILTSILALIISNIGATVLMVPLAIDLASNFNLAPRMVALTVAIAAANTFIIPTHQVNALIAGPGNYKNSDFFKSAA